MHNHFLLVEPEGCLLRGDVGSEDGMVGMRKDDLAFLGCPGWMFTVIYFLFENMQLF